MTTLIRLPELAGRGRLGRHVLHDPRSLRYLTAAAPAAPIAWPRYTPILDQAATSSCTGNAITGALGSGPLYAALRTAGLLAANQLDETEAQAIYSDAEILDGGAGLPTEDEGSTGLSVAKVTQRRGLISGYRHATSIAQAHGALQAGPFIIGTDWLTGMDSPGTDGVVRVSGTSRGGHEYLCREYDPARDLWWMDNSWGTSFGRAGRFAYDTPGLQTLLGRGGDVTSLVPVTAPAPTPQPSAVRTFASADDIRALDDWAAAPHVWRKATAAARAWKRASA